MIIVDIESSSQSSLFPLLFNLPVQDFIAVALPFHLSGIGSSESVITLHLYQRDGCEPYFHRCFKMSCCQKLSMKIGFLGPGL